MEMNFSKLKIGLLDILFRHRNGYENINFTIFSNFSLKFAIDFNFFWIFLSFSELIDLQGPMNIFQVLQI